MDSDQRIQRAIENTELIRSPKQKLATFGVTDIYYYLLTKPLYSELADNIDETVVREGRIIAERPKIVTPHYLLSLFQGFEHGQEYADYILRNYGPNEPGLLYRYRNEPAEMNISSSPMESVVQNISRKIDEENNPLAAIIKGIDELWDISLMKFIHDLTRRSLSSNVMELGMRGLLDMDPNGIPRHTRVQIEHLFAEAMYEKAKVHELEAELLRWGLFHEYEDRFLDLFRKK